MPAYYPEGNTPLREDYTERSLQKINDILNSGVKGKGRTEIVWDNGRAILVTQKDENGVVLRTTSISYDGNGNPTVIERA